jgi:hypothetical protein
MMPMRMRRKPQVLEKSKSTVALQPWSTSCQPDRALPEISHFGAKFYECCAASTGGRHVFPKFGGIRANVLAMQRGGP